jgi:uncharacterized membrane protein
MVSAYAAATTNGTPRATQLLVEDRTAQNAIATFLGSFLYSVTGIAALSTGIYGANGRVVLFAVTLLVIGGIVVTLLRWIEHLSSLGRVGETTARVEAAARAALQQWARQPRLGGRPARPMPPGAVPLTLPQRGYVQHIDLGRLSALGATLGQPVHLLVLPGALLHPGRPALWLDRAVTAEQASQLADAFSLGPTRSYEQDPRFGLVALSEIGSRALSAAINDPGTAISVVTAGGGLLADWATAQAEAAVARDQAEAAAPQWPHVHVPALRVEDLFEDFFRPLIRDGAAILEVGIRLQKVLGMLALMPPLREAALRQAEDALQHAELVLPLPQDRAVLRALLPPGAARASAV